MVDPCGREFFEKTQPWCIITFIQALFRVLIFLGFLITAMYSVLWVVYCHGFTNVHSQAKCFPYNTNYINYQFQLKNKNLKLILICRKEKILMGRNVCLNPSLLRIRYIAQTYFLVLSNKFFQIIPRLFLQWISKFFKKWCLSKFEVEFLMLILRFFSNKHHFSKKAE